MDLIWVMFGFFAFVTIVFVALAFMYPEIVGITGKKAHEIQKHQQQDDDSTTNTKP
ncbi:MAG: hypothetical protein H7256_02175 [Bdellovibrio sp.]|nr:hypothetical protein [Bdellovibrio sp.]